MSEGVRIAWGINEFHKATQFELCFNNRASVCMTPLPTMIYYHRFPFQEQCNLSARMRHLFGTSKSNAKYLYRLHEAYSHAFASILRCFAHIE